MFDLQYSQYKYLIGCDEVGRGPLAGPVVACAVKMDTPLELDEYKALGVVDSKKLSEKKRTKILEALKIDVCNLHTENVYQLCPGASFTLCSLSAEDIDAINILQASLKAMKNAAMKLSQKENDFSGMILIDGNKKFSTNQHTEAVVKGDSKSILIGLASIIAKNFRDEKMKQWDQIYPGYFFSQHAGYPTAQHRSAIAKLGVSPIHRKSFKGVKEYL